MPSYAVVGASRGIGLEYVRQLASRSDTVVFAIVRNPAGSTYLHTATESLKNVHVIAGDVEDYSTLEHAASQVSAVTGGKLDYLIHNAALLDLGTLFKGFDDYANMEELDTDFLSAFKVNSLGPVHSITAFLPLLRASNTKTVVVIGSASGDLTSVRALGMANMAAYGVSKAAATIIITKFALKLEKEGFVVVTLEPGVVDTTGTAAAHARDVFAAIASGVKEETGRDLVMQTPEASVAAQLKVIDGLGPSHNGLFLSHMGGEFRAPSITLVVRSEMGPRVLS